MLPSENPVPASDTGAHNVQVSRAQFMRDRRKFLKLLVLTFGGALAGCIPQDGKTPTSIGVALPPTPGSIPTIIADNPTEIVTLAPVDTEIVGPMPGKYSEIVLKHNLIPRAYEAKEDPPTRIMLAISYLDKLKKALEEAQNRPEMTDKLLPSLGALHITDRELFPIDLYPETNALDIVSGFLEDFRQSRFFFSYDSSQNYLIATRNNFYVQGDGTQTPTIDSLWQRKTEFIVGEPLIAGFNTNEDGTHYYAITDAEVAFLLLHEYAHSKQGDAYVNIINSYKELRQQLYSENGNQLSSAIIAEAIMFLGDADKQVFNDRFAQTTVQAGEDIHARSLGLRTTNLLPHEIQANSVAYYVLKQLNVLNGSVHVPGTSFQDPGPRQIELVRAIQISRGEIPNYDSLYRLWEETGYATSNALDPRWLIYGGQ